MGNEAAVLKSIQGEAMSLLGVATKGTVDGLLFTTVGRTMLSQPGGDQHRGGLQSRVR